MYSLEEANAELKQSKLKKGGALIIEGPESMTRNVPEIPAGLTPGQYRFEWMIFEPGSKEKIVPVSGQFIVEPETEQPEQEELAGDPFAIAERLAAERLADREVFYQNMLKLNAQAQERIESERERVWQMMETRLQGMQKLMHEQVKNTPQQVTVERPGSEKSEWWEPILEKYGDQLFPVVVQALAKMGAKDIPVPGSFEP